MKTTAPDAHPSLRTRARQYAEFLNLPFRNRTWKGLTGDLAGGGAGSSLDFQDHRTYVPGDDPRHINWQAYARTGHYTMKLYREEVRPMVDLILDVSQSMTNEPEKETRALELFYFCIESAIRNAASLRVFCVVADRHARLTEESLYSAAWLDEAAALAPAHPEGPPRLDSLPLRGWSMRVFISDLLFPGSPGEVATPLAAGNGRAVMLAPYTDSEARPDWAGNYEFIDSETRTHHLNRIEAPLLKRYLEAYRRHFELWRTIAVKQGVAFARVPAEPDFERALHLEAVPRGTVERWI